MKFIYKIITLIIILVPGIFKDSSAQYAVGDFGATSSGNWTAAIWSTYNGAGWTPTVSIPTSTKNVFILAGNTVRVVSSPSSCRNLQVEGGAKLWTNGAANIFVYVYGPTLICDGQIGNGATFDGISFGIEGAGCTISGNGVFDASVIRKNLAAAATTNLIISRDVNLLWNAAPTTQLYNAASNTNFNLTINAGATVNLIPGGPGTGNVCVDGVDGAATLATEAGGTFTINGTLIISGKLYATTNNTNPAFGCKWIINGLVQANEVVAANSGLATHSLTINGGGKLELNGTPAWSTLGVTNNTFVFNNGSTVEYSAAGNQIVRVASQFGGAILNQYSNLILSNAGNKSTTLTDLWVRNDITITGNAVLDPLGSLFCNIFIGGNWLNYNSIGFNEKTTTVYFNGGTAQTITCPGGEVYYTLRYQNGASFLQFNSSVSIIKLLLFASNGYINLNSNALNILNPAPTGISGGAPTRYIVSEKTDNSSKIKWSIGTGTGIYTFPFGVFPGTPSNFVPVVIGKSDSTTIGDVTIATYSTPPDNLPWPTTPTSVTNLQSYVPIHNVPDNRHWTVDRFWQVDATSPITIDSLKFSYRLSELPDSDATPANLGAQFWNESFGYWYNAQYGTGAANYVSVPLFNIFNTAWTLTSHTSPLPIKLLSFNADPKDDRVKLTWVTETEINNDYFTIEKSVDGNEFYPIGKVAGAGNSTITINYFLDDPNPLRGISYYRLKQTDYDGLYSYSETIPVNYKKSITDLKLFPNPAKDIVYLISGAEINAEVYIRNAEGKIVQQINANTLKQIQPIKVSGLISGVYIVEVKTDKFSQNQRLIKE